jgi:hypothetical protein
LFEKSATGDADDASATGNSDAMRKIAEMDRTNPAIMLERDMNILLVYSDNGLIAIMPRQPCG